MQKIIKIGIPVFLVCVAIVIWAVAFSGETPRADAQRLPPNWNSPCNTANVAGSYSYAAFGSVGTNPFGFPVGPYNSVAILRLDGAGNYNIKAKTSYNGTVIDEEFNGTYIVGENCAITYMYLGLPAVYAVFTGNRHEARAVWTLQGLNITGLTVKQ